ncbi:MAG: MliC family protein [Rhodanobacter sp.]
MKTRHVLLIIQTALLVGCQTPVPAIVAKTLTYACADGRTVQAVYPDTDNAVLRFDGQTHQLHIAVSADGARYVGQDWQWWTTGMHEGRLAPLKSGETIASASGVSCIAP